MSYESFFLISKTLLIKRTSWKLYIAQ